MASPVAALAMGSAEKRVLGQFMDNFILLLEFFFLRQITLEGQVCVSQISSEQLIETQFQRQGKEDIA